MRSIRSGFQLAWLVGLTVLSASIVVVILTAATANAAVWAVPGTNYPGLKPTSAVVYDHTLKSGSHIGPLIITSLFHPDGNNSIVEQLNIRTGKSSDVARLPGDVGDLKTLPSGDILATQGDNRLIRISVEPRGEHIVLDRATPIELSNGQRLPGIEQIRAIDTDKAGHIFVLFSVPNANGYFVDSFFVGEITKLGTADSPTHIKILAGGGRDIPNVSSAPENAKSVKLSQPTDLAVDSAGNFFIVGSEIGSTGGTGPGLIHFSTNANGELTVKGIDVTVGAISLDPSGADLFATYRGTIYLLAKFHLPSLTRTSVFSFLASGGQTPSAKPVDFVTPANGFTVDTLPDGNMLIVQPTVVGPLWFRGSGPDETRLLKMLTEAREAASEGKFEIVKAIHEELVITESASVIPTDHLLNSLLIERHVPGQPSTLKLPSELVGELTQFAKDSRRRALLLPLRSRMALTAMRAEIPHLSKILAAAK